MTTQLTPGEAKEYLGTAEIYIKQGAPRHMMVPAVVVRDLCQIAIDALPSEGDRERSERTAEGVRVDLPVTRDELVRIRNSACGVDYVRISSRMLDTLCTYAIESRYDSPPASPSMSADQHCPLCKFTLSGLPYCVNCDWNVENHAASMSAGVTDAMVTAALLSDETAVERWKGRGIPAPEIIMRENLEAAERARANTRAGVEPHWCVECGGITDPCPRLAREQYSARAAGDAKGAG